MQEQIQRFEMELKNRNYSKRTIDIYLQCMRYYIENWIKNDIGKINRDDIVRYKGLFKNEVWWTFGFTFGNFYLAKQYKRKIA